MLFGGDEFWFFGPRVFPGDKLRLERMLYDYRITNTSFAGPTMFSRGDTVYYNQRGESIASATLDLDPLPRGKRTPSRLVLRPHAPSGHPSQRDRRHPAWDAHSS